MVQSIILGTLYRIQEFKINFSISYIEESFLYNWYR